MEVAGITSLQPSFTGDPPLPVTSPSSASFTILRRPPKDTPEHPTTTSRLSTTEIDANPLSHDLLTKIDAYWRACNDLAAGMIYLRDNPLLREPLAEIHLKKRLLGHWGASPGFSLVAVAVGDGEAETGPLATSWHSSKFLNPIRDGAVLPILHLNGYKINNPTLLARIPREELAELMRGYGWTPYFVEGDDLMTMHQTMAATLDACLARIRAFQQEARTSGKAERCHWPMIVLRTPKGWTGPAEVDGKKVEGFWRAHQVPLSGMHDNPAHLKQLESWLRSYKPEELFDGAGRLIPELRALAPEGTLRMSANPQGTAVCCVVPCGCPTFATTPWMSSNRGRSAP